MLWVTWRRAASAAEPARLSQHEQKAREIYAKVIAMPTSKGNGQVPVMAEYLAGEFRAAGFPAADVSVVPFEGVDDKTASLVVRYRGNGKGGKPILLLAHMDVVAAKREDWERSPFELIEENGFFYGRGTYDDKQGVVAITSTFLRLKAEGFVPSRDLILFFSGDEETAQATTMNMAHEHRELIDAEFALNGDAGGGTLDDDTGKALYYSLQTAEKTYADFTVTVRNPGGHSSLPRDDNAIYDLAVALLKVRDYKFPVMWNDTTVASLRQAGTMTPGELGEALRKFADNPRDAAAAAVIARDPSYVGQTRTTCVATMLSGGHGENALPQSATRERQLPHLSRREDRGRAAGVAAGRRQRGRGQAGRRAAVERRLAAAPGRAQGRDARRAQDPPGRAHRARAEPPAPPTDWCFARSASRPTASTAIS